MKCLGKVARTANVEKRDWKKAVNDFLRSYRATPHLSTGVSPAQLMYPQRRFKTELPQLFSKLSSDAAIKKFNEAATKRSKSYADLKRKVLLIRCRLAIPFLFVSGNETNYRPATIPFLIK